MPPNPDPTPASDAPPANAPPRRPPLSVGKKLFFGFVVTASFFVVLEMGLAFLDVGRRSTTEDPFVGFDSYHPLFQRSAGPDDTTLLSTAPGKRVWFNSQSFTSPKPAGTKRIFCVGGSTTFGRPYDNTTSYSGWLQAMLPVAAPETDWQVINAGGVSYASYRVAAVMEELAEYEPDLFIIYSAHNEFLERRTYAGLFESSAIELQARSLLQETRTWNALDRLLQRVRPAADAPPAGDLARQEMPGEVDELLNHSVGPADYHRDDQWRAGIVNHYRVNLRRMVSLARSVGAEVMFVTPAANEKDCSPFKSERSNELTPEQSEQWQEAVRQGELTADSGDPRGAVKHYQNAVSLDPRHSQTCYELGRLLLQCGRHEEAREAFQRAIDEDVCPLRAVKELKQSVRQIADEQQVVLVDFENLLRQECLETQGHDCLGAEYFLDHVHPTIDAHQQLAGWILAQIGDTGLPVTQSLTADQSRQVDRSVRAKIDTRSHGIALRNLAKVLHWSGKFEEAMPRARDATTYIARDPESLFILADCLYRTGRHDEALETYQRLFRHGEFSRAYLPYGELLLERGESQSAIDFLALAAVHHQDDHLQGRVYYSLGTAYLQARQYDLAVMALAEAHRLYPENVATLAFLAQAHAGNGEEREAIDCYRRAARLDATDASLRQKLGLLLLRGGDAESAAEEFRTALAIDPANLDAQKYLSIAGSITESARANAPPSARADPGSSNEGDGPVQ